MECKQIHEQLRSQQALDAISLAHLESCEACRLLAEEGGALAHQLDAAEALELPDLGQMMGQLQHELAQEAQGARKLKSLKSGHKLAILWGMAFLLLGAILAFSPRKDIAQYPLARMLVGLGMMGFLSLLGLWYARRPMHEPPWPDTQRIALWTACLLAPLGFALLPVVHTGHPASLAGLGSAFPVAAAKCFGYGIFVTAPLFVLAWLLSHDEKIGASVAYSWAVTAGLLANIALMFHCPIVHTPHLVVAHAAIGFFLWIVAVVWLKAAARSSTRRSDPPTTA